MIYDYYDIENYYKESYDFFRIIENYGKKNPFGDIYLSYLELPQDIKERLPKEYEIDMDAYLFHMIRFYNLKSRHRRKQFLKHPYIKSLTIDDGINHIHTEFGDVDFKYWISGYSDILKKSINNRNNEPIIKNVKLLFDEYIGAYDGRCHEASINFCGPNKVVTAFVAEPQSELRYLHSFVEIDEKVLETTANFIMSKEDYYRLLKPDVLTEISGEELLELYQDYFDKHPRLKDMPIKQLLIDFEEVKRNPDTIKIKKLSR